MRNVSRRDFFSCVPRKFLTGVEENSSRITSVKTVKLVEVNHLLSCSSTPGLIFQFFAQQTRNVSNKGFYPFVNSTAVFWERDERFGTKEHLRRGRTFSPAKNLIMTDGQFGVSTSTGRPRKTIKYTSKGHLIHKETHIVIPFYGNFLVFFFYRKGV